MGALSVENIIVEILLVEDNPDDAELTLLAFKEYNLANHIQVVRDGAEALDFVYAKGLWALHRSRSASRLLLAHAEPFS